MCSLLRASAGGIEGPEQEVLYRPLEDVRTAATEALISLDQMVSGQGGRAPAAKAARERAFEQVSRHVGVLRERASASGQEGVLLDVLLIDFAARHASALVGHPGLGARLLGSRRKSFP